MSDELPDAHFGDVDKPLPDWRKKADKDEAGDDDEPLDKTPADVTDMLGFDPVDEADE